MTFDLTKPEEELLDKKQIKIFRDRIILDAQPSIDDQTIAKIEEFLVGPIPEDFLSLWRISFGGSLDYDVPTELDGVPHNVAMAELFFPESEHYSDIWGWIEKEIEILDIDAKENGREFGGKLAHLPFAGFEYSDRVYVTVEPGDNYGEIVHYTAGNPWFGSEGAGHVASSIQETFDMMRLPRNLDLLDDFDRGMDYIRVLEELKEEGSVGEALSKKLESILNATVIDWREALSKGRLIGDEGLEDNALEDIMRDDDVEAMKQLLDAGLDGSRFTQNSLISNHMAYGGAWKVVELLRQRGANMHHVLHCGQDSMPVEIAKGLVADGTAITQEMIISALNHENNALAKFLQEKFSATATVTENADLGVALRSQATIFDDLAVGLDIGSELDGRSADHYRSQATVMRNMGYALFPHANAYVSPVSIETVKNVDQILRNLETRHRSDFEYEFVAFVQNSEARDLQYLSEELTSRANRLKELLDGAVRHTGDGQKAIGTYKARRSYMTTLARRLDPNRRSLGHSNRNREKRWWWPW